MAKLFEYSGETNANDSFTAVSRGEISYERKKIKPFKSPTNKPYVIRQLELRTYNGEVLETWDVTNDWITIATPEIGFKGTLVAMGAWGKNGGGNPLEFSIARWSNV